MAAILESLLRSCTKKLQDKITDEAILILGVEKELELMLRRVEIIRCCIYDAEKRRTTELAVKNWLGQLRDVIYDVDEILDVAICKGSKLLPNHPSSSSSKSVACKGLLVSSCFFNIRPRRDVAVRIRSLNTKIDNISKNTIFLTFNNSIQPTTNVPASRMARSSNLDEPILVGKDIINSRKKLVDLVLSHKKDKCYKLAIVGTGGVGKTTLAQNIYNDQKIKGSFNMHSWISVSRDYNEVSLLKEVLRNIGVHHEQGETIAELQRKLSETIEGKSFFLVLDDVWHSNVWTYLLRTPLHVATRVILVTTRDDQIAMSIGVQHIHPVELMSTDVGWELLWKSMNIDEEKEVHDLRNTGIEIVRKCGHLPLAIKVTASALATRDLTENKWTEFLGRYVGSQNTTTNEIEGVLYLSYDDLPLHLKQCFLYCALYTEDSVICKAVITKLWISEGFVEDQQGQLLEDIAEGYYYELIHRNLLQPHERSFTQSLCRMHDLLRKLALKISIEECFVGDVETLSYENMSKLRRVTAVTKKDKLVLPGIDKVEIKVRTFLTIQGTQGIDNTLFKRFRLLRVLVLNFSHVQSIPDDVGKLIHLRLLDLNYTGISSLPESIGCLKNLQVLSLCYCAALHSLPLAMTQLCNLRSLCLFGTVINAVRKGIGKLKFLTELGEFPVGGERGNADVQDGWRLEELSSMTHMRHLDLVRLERAIHCSTSTVLANKKHLKVLVLHCSVHEQRSYSEEDVSNIEKIFEQLMPPCNLESLVILRFFGRQYPTWFDTTFLSSLLHLTLRDVQSCVDFPPLGQLRSLKYLRVDGAFAVTKVGPEFAGCGEGDPMCNELVAFPKLEWLIFQDMPNWEEWSFFEEEVAADEWGEGGALEIQKENAQSTKIHLLPRLVYLELTNCPKLRVLPQRQLGEDAARLKKLVLNGTNCLKTLEDFPHLSDLLVIHECEGLERVSNLHQVTTLEVLGCPNLNHVEGLCNVQRVGLSEDMQGSSSHWVSGLQKKRRLLHGENLDVYMVFPHK